ncbi:MAG: PAS domain-containing protein [Deinococcota bacterium]
MTHRLEEEFYNHLSHKKTIFNFIKKSPVDVLWFGDPQQPSKAWYSDEFWKTLGYSPDEMNGNLPWETLVHPDDLLAARNNLDQHLANEEYPYDQIIRFYAKDGSTVWMHSRGQVLRDEQGKPTRMFGTHVNVTDRNKQLSESDDLLSNPAISQALLHNEHVYIITILREGTYSYVSPSFCRDVGRERQDIVGSSSLFAVIPEDHHKCVEAAEFCFTHPHQPYHVTLRKRFKDGSVHITQWEFIGLFGANRQAYKILGIGLDITKRVKAEIQERYLTNILNNAQAIASLGGWEVNVQTNDVIWTDQVFAIHEVEPDFQIELESALNFYPPEDQLKVQYALAQAVAEQRSFDILCRFITAKNNARWVRVVGDPIVEGGTVTHVRGVFQDVTEQKNAELTLQALVEEKDALLKEIHHRVKNNLQVVASLLDLQIRNVPDGPGQEAIKSSQRRIAAIAAVHKALYEHKSFSRIEFSVYIKQLLNSILEGIGRPHIKVVYDIQPVVLTIEDAVPCGLIANELITNALKHAFPDKIPNPTLTVHLSQFNNEVCLSVIDNGIQISMKDVVERRKQSTSLGMTVVEALAMQLGGGLDIRPLDEGGTGAALHFHPHARESAQYKN